MPSYIHKCFIGLLCLLSFNGCAQPHIKGNFPELAGQQIRLEAFQGFSTYVLDSARVDKKGSFILNYPKDLAGAGQLVAKDNKPFVVILDDENIFLEGEALALPASIEIIKGQQNLLFGRYASEHPRREQALSAWGYLEKIYKKDSLFAKQEQASQAIEKEMQRIKEQDEAFLGELNPESYLSYYLPLRKRISSVGTIAQYRTHLIPETIEAFRNMDYTSANLYHSGLLGQAIESHFWLIENSGRSLDSVYVEMNKSIDAIVDNLMADEQKLNEISDYLFKLLEKRSLFKASEHLALKLLNKQGCTLNNDLAAQLESYRAMKKGNTAPDIVFTGDVVAPNSEGSTIQKLSDIQTPYTVVVFGANWCPQCPGELSYMATVYDKWKNQGVEVLFVSLDTDETTFQKFAGKFPFISTCDYLKWESKAVKDYYVFATPTLFLLNREREILLRPNSAKHMDSWVDWFLVNGNK